MKRISLGQLQAKVDYLNLLTGHNLVPYTYKKGRAFVANHGTYHIQKRKREVKLVQVIGYCTDQVVSDVGWCTIQQLYCWVSGFIKGYKKRKQCGGDI